MQLNLPILGQLADSQNILIAGAGGGFDIFCGLPIYFTLRELGKTVHLANYSFSSLEVASAYTKAITLRDGLLVGAQGEVSMNLPYYPEGFLAQWFKETRDEDVTVWMFGKTGAKTLHEVYQQLTARLDIDAIILIDGGIDSLTRGDETGAGTFLEDAISLAAVDNLDIPVKILACLGFGAELEVCHYNALDNIASLAKTDAFLGSCSLLKQMPAYSAYESACRYVWEQPGHAKSHINMRVVSAAGGEFGNYHLYQDPLNRPVFVSPLMNLYWFFDAKSVIERSMIIDQIRMTVTAQEAFAIVIQLRELLQSHARPHNRIPY